MMDDRLTGKEHFAFMLLNSSVIERLEQTRAKGPYEEWKPSKAELLEDLRRQIDDLEKAIGNMQSGTVTKKCANLVVFAMKVNDIYGQIIPNDPQI